MDTLTYATGLNAWMNEIYEIIQCDVEIMGGRKNGRHRQTKGGSV